MKNEDNDTYIIDFEDILPPIDYLTKNEIKFVRNYLDRLKVDINEDQDIVISTLTSEKLGYFITDIIREYNIFINKYPFF